MKKKQNNKKNNLTLKRIIVFGCILFLIFFLWKLTDKPITVTGNDQQKLDPALTYKNHLSNDLKISFNYPTNWYLDDRYHKILLTNYATNLNRNDKPTSTQVEIDISNFSGCHQTIEENLKDPACGEGGPSVPLNKIVSKETSQKIGGIFYKYIIEYPNGQHNIFYLLQQKNSDRILQISKEPDPSKFDKEFMDIVSSITFL